MKHFRLEKLPFVLLTEANREKKLLIFLIACVQEIRYLIITSRVKNLQGIDFFFTFSLTTTTI